MLFSFNLYWIIDGFQMCCWPCHATARVEKAPWPGRRWCSLIVMIRWRPSSTCLDPATPVSPRPFSAMTSSLTIYTLAARAAAKTMRGRLTPPASWSQGQTWVESPLSWDRWADAPHSYLNVDVYDVGFHADALCRSSCSVWTGDYPRSAGLLRSCWETTLHAGWQGLHSAGSLRSYYGW